MPRPEGCVKRGVARSDRSMTEPELTAELFALLEKELVKTWAYVNWSCFREAMRPPVLAVVESDRLGAYKPELRRLELSRALCLGQPWHVVVEVLKHEMAHQYVCEVLRVTDETAHGPAFRRTCEQLGVDATASGLPEAYARSPEEERLVERVAKLLALAESPNEHEAQAAATTARKLMLKHDLDERAANRVRRYGARTLGEPSLRHAEWENHLANVLSKHFFVEVIWAHSYLLRQGKLGTVLEITGTFANLEMAEYVYVFLRDTGLRLFEEKRKAGLVGGKRDRDRFLAGVIQGFRDKLDAETKVQAAAGLVWRGDADLHHHFARRHPRVHRRTFGGAGPSEAQALGRREGGSLVLRKPVGGGEGGSRGRLLGR